MKFLVSIAFVILSVFQSRSFYEVLNDSSLQEIDSYRSQLDTTASQRAYQAMLLMRRAEYVSGSFNKLSSFKEGKELLEEVIMKHSQNVEYRFLRLMIQENVPWFLGYSGDIDEDSDIVVKGFREQSADLRTVMLGYSEESEALMNKLK